MDKTIVMLNQVLPYLRIARFDHWFKNVFLLPGIGVALFAELEPGLLQPGLLWRILLAFLAVGLITSSNYVINEILDAPQDALHPGKKHRPAACGQIVTPIGYLEWIVLGLVGLSLAWTLGVEFACCALALWIMGCIYNIPPLRTKEKPILDVLTESVNNALRLILGWYATGTHVIPSLSLVMAFWMIGAFFMAVNRFAAYRRIGNPSVAAGYRKSFGWYNEERLLTSIVIYASAFGMFFGIFLIRYRIELILAVPLMAGLIGTYIHLGYKKDSPVQYPEKLYKQKFLVIYSFFCFAVMLALMYIDLPWLGQLFAPTLTTYVY